MLKSPISNYGRKGEKILSSFLKFEQRKFSKIKIVDFAPLSIRIQDDHKYSSTHMVPHFGRLFATFYYY